MSDVITAVAVLIGTIWLLLAALALIRMPDVYCRLSATTKAVTFGVSMMLLGASFALDDTAVTLRALAGIAFFFLTSPIAAHVLARAAHLRGTPMWEGSLLDESAAEDAPRVAPAPELQRPRHPDARDAEA